MTLYSHDIYSYGLYSHALYSYGLYSYGLYSYGRRRSLRRLQACIAQHGTALHAWHATARAQVTAVSPPGASVVAKEGVSVLVSGAGMHFCDKMPTHTAAHVPIQAVSALAFAD